MIPRGSAGDAARAAGTEPADELHLELYYNLKVNEGLSISPDIQWVNNAGGDRDCSSVWVFGVRSQLSF